MADQSDQPAASADSGGAEKPESSAAAGDHTVGDVLDRLDEAAQNSDGDEVTVGDMLDAFGGRAYGPLLLVPAAIALIPIVGAIPGVSIAAASWILLVALQMIFRQQGVWMPARLREQAIPQDKLQRGVDKSRRYAKWIDKLSTQRLQWVTRPPLSYSISVACIALAAMMFPLAFVPFGVAPPAAAVLLLALGVTARDGLLAAGGLLLTGVCGWFAWWMLAGG